eukprot:4451406-Pleurochrysis_carterae.AAC.1
MDTLSMNERSGSRRAFRTAGRRARELGTIRRYQFAEVRIIMRLSRNDSSVFTATRQLTPPSGERSLAHDEPSPAQYSAIESSHSDLSVRK